MHETIWPQGQELLAVEWQQFAENTFTEPIITKAKQEGIKSSQPEASKKVYTPPHLRGGNNVDKIIQPQSTIPGLPPGKERQFWQRKYDLQNPITRPGSWRERNNNDNSRQEQASNDNAGRQRHTFNKGTNRYKPYGGYSQQKRRY